AATHGALPAVEREAPEGRRRENSEDQAVSLIGADGADIAGDREAADRGEHAGRNIAAPGDALAAAAGGARCFWVAAYGIKGAAEVVGAENQSGHDEGD